MNKTPIKLMSEFELKREIRLLTILKESLKRCMAVEEGFTDANALELLNDTYAQLNYAKQEEWNRATKVA